MAGAVWRVVAARRRAAAARCTCARRRLARGRSGARLVELGLLLFEAQPGDALLKLLREHLLLAVARLAQLLALRVGRGERVLELLDALRRGAALALAARVQLLALRARLLAGSGGAGVWTLGALAAQWEDDPKYLVREIAALLPVASRGALLDCWPRVLAEAERRSRHAQQGGG